MTGCWIAPEVAEDLAAEETTIHRVWSSDTAWIERFGDDYLISSPNLEMARTLVEPLQKWALVHGGARRVFARQLVKQPRESDVPVRLAGADDLPLETVASERGLKFLIDFGAGYSAGLFCDQRLNRAHLEELRPARVLNCFAYTCAFTVVAARAGAETLSVDLARKSLDRGRRNLALNHLPTDGHRFLADDVLTVLPRLARRGERFDAIILDPPTFSRGEKGKIFRVEEDMARLFELACAVGEPGGHILLSTNARQVTVPVLRAMALESGRALDFHETPALPDFGVHRGASTAWATLSK